jgi:hypothetical protein
MSVVWISYARRVWAGWRTTAKWAPVLIMCTMWCLLRPASSCSLGMVPAIKARRSPTLGFLYLYPRSVALATQYTNLQCDSYALLYARSRMKYGSASVRCDIWAQSHFAFRTNTSCSVWWFGDAEFTPGCASYSHKPSYAVG